MPRPSARVYFYSVKTGRELDHIANGLPYSGNGPHPMINGRFDREAYTSITTDIGPRSRTWTEADFDEPVIAKLWYPGNVTEWYRLKG